MLEAITERILRDPPLLLDGATGSRLIDLGLPAGLAPEAWVLEHPDAIRQVHQEHRDAGSDIIAACTFGGNRQRLKKGGLAERITALNQQAVVLARKVAGDDIYVAADLGPTGEFFQPHGKLTEEDAREIYEEQVSILLETEIDFFLLETFYDLKEAMICVEACRKIAPGIPVGALLTFNDTPRGFFTVMGDPAAEALMELAAEGAFLVGSNCTLEAAGMLKLAEHLSRTVDHPLLFQANAGSPQISADGIVYPQGPQEFAGYIGKMLELGVRVIGGCCGTTAAHIAELRALIDAHSH